VAEHPREISDSAQSARGTDAMLIADYIAISVLALTLFAGAERFLRGKRLIAPNPPLPRA
jgi:hypothetical protein